MVKVIPSLLVLLKHMLTNNKLLASCLMLVSEVLSNKGVDFYEQDLLCLTANVYFEAGAESEKGQEAVAKVTVNRSKHKRYKQGICGVVFAKKQFSWVMQKPWSIIEKVLNGHAQSDNALEHKAYQRCKIVASRVLSSGSRVLPDNTIAYHATYVQPKWSESHKQVAKIGRHIFYGEK